MSVFKWNETHGWQSTTKPSLKRHDCEIQDAPKTPRKDKILYVPEHSTWKRKVKECTEAGDLERLRAMVQKL